MEGLCVFEPLSIQSHKGEYQVYFEDEIIFKDLDLESCHFLIDANVARQYQHELAEILKAPSVLIIEATEQNKTLDKFPFYVESLVQNKIRRDHRLIAVGGGIIQDITCFLAATILRGVEWWFYPTTLLAQADSCIGSKSSINAGGAKNILGTFTPPKKVFVFHSFLKSLKTIDLCSGIGEMLKVHAIDSPSSFDQIANDYDRLFQDQSTMLHYIRRSLEIKKNIIEQDEFDTGIRNIMNYGHTFGHAIESATNYQVPHGVAVTIGMDMANYISSQFDIAVFDHFLKMHPILIQNYRYVPGVEIPLEPFILAISKDKKNKDGNLLGLIIPNNEGKLMRIYIENDKKFKEVCINYLANWMYQTNSVMSQNIKLGVSR